MSMIQLKEIQVSSYITKSKLPDSDFVINPYIGCEHQCKYCYACFMSRFTNHTEGWGNYVDIKRCSKNISIENLAKKTIFMSSVTDCYQPCEKTYQITRNILEQLQNGEFLLTISTKSKLIIRDLDILKKIKNLTVAVSINTLDEAFKNDMDKASSISERIETLKILHENHIKTVLFMSPIFPELTDYRAIIEKTKNVVDCYWFENLNLRGSYSYDILQYIHTHYPQYDAIYQRIYVKKDTSYWENMSLEIDKFCKQHGVSYHNYFYHEKIRKN